MRKKIIAANWKMNKTINESIHLVEETLSLLPADHPRDAVVILCPPFISLAKVSEALQNNKKIFSGAQNCHWENFGAYTGEISAAMIKSAGAGYVILGHSERRQYFNETNEQLAQKANTVLSEGLIPIFCCGEPLNIRESNTHFELLQEQITKGLFHLMEDEFRHVIIAYEPVWAIGTGKVASEEQAQEMHEFIRHIIRKQYGEEVAGITPIIYGGSMKPSNARGLLSQSDVDGGLIGGASLEAADFVEIIKAV